MANLYSSSVGKIGTNPWQRTEPPSKDLFTACTLAPCTSFLSSSALLCVFIPLYLGSNEGCIFIILSKKTLQKEGLRILIKPASAIKLGSSSCIFLVMLASKSLVFLNNSLLKMKVGTFSD